MSDFSALWHSCSRLSARGPPGDSGDMTNDKSEVRETAMCLAISLPAPLNVDV